MSTSRASLLSPLPPSSRPGRWSVALLVVPLALAGCARPAPTGQASAPSPAPSMSSSTQAVPPATPDLPRSSDLAKPSKRGSLTETGTQIVTGRVEAGVENDCLVLSGYVLIFDDPSLRAKARPGASVTVTGRSDPAMMTTCQQGTPFLVVTVDPK